MAQHKPGISKISRVARCWRYRSHRFIVSDPSPSHTHYSHLYTGLYVYTMLGAPQDTSPLPREQHLSTIVSPCHLRSSSRIIHKPLAADVSTVPTILWYVSLIELWSAEACCARGERGAYYRTSLNGRGRGDRDQHQATQSCGDSGEITTRCRDVGSAFKHQEA